MARVAYQPGILDIADQLGIGLDMLQEQVDNPEDNMVLHQAYLGLNSTSQRLFIGPGRWD